MPKYKLTPDDEELMNVEKTRETTPGLIIAGGDITPSEYSTLDWPTQIRDYTEMRDGDPIVKRTIDILKMPILGAEFEVTPGNDSDKAKEAADYIEWSLNNLFKGFQYFKRHLLLALDYGVSMFEKVYMRGAKFNGKTTNIISYLSPIQPETIHQFHYNDQAIFTGIEHERRQPEMGSTFIDIPANKLFWFTYDEEYENIKGRPLLRSIRQMWRYKHDLILAGVRSAQKGSGIPIGTVEGTVSQSEKAQFEKLLRSVAAAKSAYVLEHKGKFTVRLEELKSQQNIQPLLDMTNREMFFNTLSEFLTSGIGIGSNGSRSATSEHKSAYELLANAVLQEMETSVEKLIDEMISISHIANISFDDYPTFKFKSIRQIDLQKIASNAVTLYQSQIVQKQPEDEKFFREMFGYPEKIETKTETVEPLVEVAAAKLETTAKNCWDFDKAEKTFLKGQEQADAIIDGTIKEIMTIFVKQMENGKDPDSLRIPMTVSEALKEKLEALYQDLYKDGETEAKKEMAKVTKGKSLSLTPKEISKKSKNIDKLVNRMMQNIKSSVEINIGKVNPTVIANAGGIDPYMKKFEDWFKSDKRNLRQEVQTGYTAGRGDVFADADIKLWMYDARLDKNLCDECAKFDGLLLTNEEINSMGLNLTKSPTNPQCLGSLGGNLCRCHLVPFEA